MTSQLISITLTTIATSIIVHGITVTPLMNWHQRRRANAKLDRRKSEN